MDNSSTGEEEQVDAVRQRIDQQNAVQQEHDWTVTEVKNRNPQNEEQHEEDWINTDSQEERTVEQIVPESLDRRILRLLSTEDEKHIERILEEINGPAPFCDSAKAEAPISLPELVSCLMRLKIERGVEEVSTGYYRKI